MHGYERERERLAARWAELDARIRIAEREAGEWGFTSESCAIGDLRGNPILDSFLRPVRRERSRAESALRRIDRREFDTCIHCGGEIDRHRLEEMPHVASCRQCSPEPPHLLSDTLTSQHNEIRNALSSILEVVSMVRCRIEEASDSRAERCAFAALVTSFERELEEHFRHEEAEGAIYDLVESAPQYSRKAMGLVQEHQVLGDRIREIRIACHQPSEDPGLWRGFEVRCQGLADDLLEHESAENHLIQAILLDDLGGRG